MDKLDSLFENSGLIAKKIAGKLSEKEFERFNEWLSSSEKNRAFYEKIQDKRNFFARNEQYEYVNTKKAWERFSEKVTIKRKERRMPLLLKYVAAILLPLLISAGIYWMINERSAEEDQNIRPGKRSAFLVLSNGEKIDLSKEDKEALRETDGTVIKKSNDELHYTEHQPSVPKELLQDELIVPRGGEYSLVLSDGTRVSLNSMSRLIFPVRFSGDQRKVTLEGEGYFEVQKDNEHPFIVEVNGMQIQVLGTSFNVKAYQDELHVYTTLVEGKVRIVSEGRLNDEFVLEPNQQAVFDKSNTSLTINDVDAAQYTQWTAGRYVFADQTLDEIVRTLSRWYDFSYRYGDESLKTIRFEGGLNKYESVYPILDIITKTGKVKVTIKGKEVLFSK